MVGHMGPKMLNVLYVRVNDEEKARIVRAAHKAGMGLAEWCRKVLNRASTTRKTSR